MSRTIDADALIDNIKTFRCIDCERRKGMKNGKLKFLYEIGGVPCRACDVADMIDTIDEAPTVGGWISVKDRLPENNRFVLVCNDDGHMMVAQYIEETVQWQYKYINYDVDVWDDEEQGPVCWWAELPEPPKEEKDDA